MLQRGQLFAGRYRIEGRLAQGGMGVIYAAEHVATEECVALKVLWPHVLGSKAAAENFQLEARIAARLGSEHIVRILDAGFDEAAGVPFLAMELLRGQTLEALVGGRGPLSPAETLWVLRQVARALDRAHGYVDRAGRPSPIVHRDLKPENIFLALPEGGEPIVKVLDFGVAKVLTASHKLSRELRGTPLFMASEQIDGGPVTPRLDVWALGLIAFFLLTGRFYWRAASNPEGGLSPLFNEVLHRPLEAPTERARRLGVEVSWPSAFDAWFLRCVNRTPDERFFPSSVAIEALGEALGVREGRALAELGGGRVAGSRAPAQAPTLRLESGAARATSDWGATPAGAPRTGDSAAKPGAPAGDDDSVVPTLGAAGPRDRAGRKLWGLVACGALALAALVVLLPLSLTYRRAGAPPGGKPGVGAQADPAAKASRDGVRAPAAFAGAPGAAHGAGGDGPGGEPGAGGDGPGAPGGEPGAGAASAGAASGGAGAGPRAPQEADRKGPRPPRPKAVAPSGRNPYEDRGD